MAEPSRRLFFALWPLPAVAAKLHRAALAAQEACGGRAMRRDTLHLTLAFLGAVPASRVDAAQAAAAAVTAQAFTLVLDRLDCWKHNRIVWAGCSEVPEALARLAEDLGRGLREAGFALEDRAFAAHATLVRNADCKVPLPSLPVPIDWAVTDFVLAESRTQPGGAQYGVVGRWPFAMH